MTCEACEHPERVHNADGCRVTGCECTTFVRAPEPGPRSRKVCIDVPDGYSVTFSLTPEKRE